MSRVVRKRGYCLCENKDADQLCTNRTVDQHLCFRYTDRTVPLLPKSEILIVLPSSAAAQVDLCRTWSEYPKTGFLATQLSHDSDPRDIHLCLFVNDMFLSCLTSVMKHTCLSCL